MAALIPAVMPGQAPMGLTASTCLAEGTDDKAVDIGGTCMLDLMVQHARRGQALATSPLLSSRGCGMPAARVVVASQAAVQVAACCVAGRRHKPIHLHTIHKPVGLQNTAMTATVNPRQGIQAAWFCACLASGGVKQVAHNREKQ